MKVIIMGCGRVGARLAGMLDARGHEVTILDTNPRSFDRLPPDFKGTALLGDGTDEEALRRAGIERADAFVAVTQGDNRNVLACQIASHVFHVPRVLCRIYDPLRRDLYESLGLVTVSPTVILSDLLLEKLLS